MVLIVLVLVIVLIGVLWVCWIAAIDMVNCLSSDEHHDYSSCDDDTSDCSPVDLPLIEVDDCD